MTATALALAPGTTGRMRPLNPLRDLSPVADLIELCFQSTMDRGGQRYLQDMRRSANDSGFMRWAAKTADTVSLPLSGFVWEDSGQIVGNVSLIPFSRRGRHIQLVANVATHPNYRRRGIGRILTDAAVEYAREKRADEIWLHVREDNPGAIKLYEDLGFRERNRRTAWQLSSSAWTAPASSEYIVLPRRNIDWPRQSTWLEINYPQEINWYYNVFWNIFEPSLRHSLGNFISDIIIDQYSVFNNNQLKANLSILRGHGNTDQLWVAAPPEHSAAAIHALLTRVRIENNSYRNFSFEYPAHIHEEAIRSAGFVPQRTLIWMKYEA